MFRVAVVEDEAAIREELDGYIRRYGQESGETFSVQQFTRGEDLLNGYDSRFDLIFMDIEMPGADGMQTARRLRQLDDQVVLVFITNMTQYAIQGYSVQAMDYILKPVSYLSFRLRFARALGRIDRQREAQILLDCPGRQVRVPVRSIRYVEVQQKRLCYHTELEDYTLRGTLKSAEEQLADFPFAKGNYWYIVNLAQVTEIGLRTLKIGETELPVSRGCRQELLAAFNRYLGGGGQQ
ncbi:LytTR family DNA-binding domain-containing protein [uncultured Gemmiger sp.]|uniref:LytR/AlgR family response regulator transcription factor n=1 Tax=uncultured Gemmiger sp. TaxID=1623490 RepID=UPI0025EC9DEC|nr:LytTR family DNA-binding domain-containing protein [uncultured Gemmiger sp.]